MIKYSLILIFLSLLIIIPIIYFALYFIYKYFLFFKSELHKLPKYGDGYIIITGPTSGIGLAILNHLTKSYNKLNISAKFCLIGRNMDNLINNMKSEYPNMEFIGFNMDFKDCQNMDFFDKIEEFINNNYVSMLINNIGHRAISNNFTEQPINEIIETINCGTMPQIRLTQLVLKQYETYTESNNKPLSIINITAQCFIYNTGLGVMYKPTISVPYLAVYEAANAFGYYLAESIYSEIKIKRRNNYKKWKNLNFLNITPGAVITDKTKNSLDWIPFACDDKQFAKGIFKYLLSRLEGQQCAHWSHELSNLLMFMTPFLKNTILAKVGTKFQQHHA